VLALIRSEYMPWLIESWSEDGGRTWSERTLTEIPSQFAPCDLIKLPDGRLVCSFSFRERRNERLVISEDGGKTWDVENSLDIFDATVGIGDRSYVSSALLSDGAIGSVLYETEPYPQGGKIWFARTDLHMYGRTKTLCLRNAGRQGDDVISLDLDGSDCTVCVRYRFTGRFELDRQGGIEVRLADDMARASFSYWMGTPRDRSKPHEPTNRWELKLEYGAQTDCASGVAKGDSFNDGNEHTLRLEYRGGKVSAALDDHTQVEETWPELSPRRLDLVAHHGGVAVYRVEVWR
ncbi:MAG: exo-alpha-sialidase, partial [Armatimonadetes bacterium]|nr:exo-alpha-sialidase [Armatimonadota bacterium]